MARSLQWGAVVGLLSLIALQSQGQDVTHTSCDEVFATYAENGETFTKEEFFDVILEELDNYFSDINPDLLEELMTLADINEDSVVDCSEYKAFINDHVKTP